MSNTEMIYGQHAVKSILNFKPFQVVEVFTTQSPAQEIIKLCKKHQISLQQIDQKKLSQLLAHDKHQGIAAKIKPAKLLTEADLPDLVEQSPSPFFLILDGIQDPHNLGAILRSADAFGVDAVIFARDRSVTVTPAVRKVACGAAEVVPIVQVGNLARAIETLKEAGVWCIGTDVEGKQSVSEFDLKGALALVMGAEGTGLRARTKSCCDALVSIPMQGMVQSLNVSVSTAICLYEARRQRA